MSFALSLKANAQVGVSTEFPKGSFHVDGMNDNPKNSSASPNNSQISNDFIVLTNGNVGVGNIQPSVKLDLRTPGSSENNAIGIDYTTMSASEAGAGAVRYMDVSGGKIQVSDGTNWKDLPSTPIKSFVVARLNQTNNSQRFLYDQPKVVTNWFEVQDPNLDFEPTTGVFTAPRDGVYTISFSYDFNQAGQVFLANSSVESQIVKNYQTIELSCLKTYGKATRGAQAAGNCVTSIKLLEDETIVVRLRQRIDNTTSSGRGLRTATNITDNNAGFTNLTIVEQ